MEYLYEIEIKYMPETMKDYYDGSIVPCPAFVNGSIYSVDCQKNWGDYHGYGGGCRDKEEVISHIMGYIESEMESQSLSYEKRNRRISYWNTKFVNETELDIENLKDIFRGIKPPSSIPEIIRFNPFRKRNYFVPMMDDLKKEYQELLDGLRFMEKWYKRKHGIKSDYFPDSTIARLKELDIGGPDGWRDDVAHNAGIRFSIRIIDICIVNDIDIYLLVEKASEICDMELDEAQTHCGLFEKEVKLWKEKKK